MKKKPNNIVQFAQKNYNKGLGASEWLAAIIKLNSDWSRVRLSNEDVETVLKIAAKLP